MTLVSDGNCRSCDAAITWVITPKGGFMPLDPEPVDDGNIWITTILDGRPVIAVALNHDGVPDVAVAYQSHFVSCPQADRWRKRSHA